MKKLNKIKLLAPLLTVGVCGGAVVGVTNCSGDNSLKIDFLSDDEIWEPEKGIWDAIGIYDFDKAEYKTIVTTHMGGAPSGSAESSGMGDAFFFDIGQDIRITGAYSSKIGTSIMYLISTNFHKKGDKIKIHAWGSKQTTTDLFTDNLSVYEWIKLDITASFK